MARRRLEAAILAGKAIEEGKECVFDKLEGRVSVYYSHKFESSRGGVFALQYSHDGKNLALGYGDGGLELLSTSNGESRREARSHRNNGLAITCLRFNPLEQHLFYAASAEGAVIVSSTIHGTVSDVITEPSNEINCLDFCSEGNVFATGGRDLNIRTYDTATNTLLRTFEKYDYYTAYQPDLAGHARRIFAIKFHPEEKNIFVSGGWDNHMKVWDIRTRDGVQRIINGPHICGDALDIKGDQILTGSWVSSNALQLWDYGSGQLLQNVPTAPSDPPPQAVNGSGDRPPPPGQYLYCAQFAEGDLILAGGTGNNGAVVVNSKTSEVVAEVDYGKTVQALDSTFGGRYFAIAGTAGKVRMVKMS